eukprot:363417-Chlamydomonas_euryale.AAC.5
MHCARTCVVVCWACARLCPPLRCLLHPRRSGTLVSTRARSPVMTLALPGCFHKAPARQKLQPALKVLVGSNRLRVQGEESRATGVEVEPWPG